MRLINAYSIARDVRLLEGRKVERKKLALWTILRMRWPILAQYLEKDPDKVDLRRKKLENQH